MPSFTFDCPVCETQIECEIVIDTAPVRGSYGLPEDSYPGEGAEWHLAEDPVCPSETCQRHFTAEDLKEEDVQERIEEYLGDRYDD